MVTTKPSRLDDWLQGVLAARGLHSLPSIWRYGLAVLAAVAVTVLRKALIPWVGLIVPYNVATIAVVISGVLLGLGPTLLFVLLADLGVEAFVVGSLWPKFDPSTSGRLAIAFFIGVFFSFVLHALRVSRDSARNQAASARAEMEERKQAEEDLRQLNTELEQRVADRTAEIIEAGEKVWAERQRFLDMLDTLPVIIDIIRADHRIEWANRAYREALGDNTGHLCYASQFDRDIPCEECQAFVPLETGQPHNWEWTLPNGRTFDIHNFPFTAADGSPAVLEMDIDITERRQAEVALRDLNETLERSVAERTKELREGEQRFRVLTQNLSSGVALIDENGRFAIVNPAFLRMFDMAETSDIKNVNDRDWAEWQVFNENGELLDVDEHPVRKAAITGTAVTRELVAVRAPLGSELKWMFVSAEPILGSDGQIDAIICTYQEVTELKRAEERIANERHLQQLLLDHFPGVVVLLRRSTREVVATNQAGIGVGAVCGSKCYETWGQSENPCPWCLAEDLWETGKEQHTIIDAGEKVFEAHWAPVTDDLYIHYALDITERQRFGEKLQEKDHLIQRALSISNSYTFDWDVTKDQVQRSDSCRKIFGADADEMCNATVELFSQRLHPDDRPRFETLIRNLTPAADTYTTDYRLVLSDGSVVTLEETAQAFFDPDGKMIRVIGAANDITERKRAESDQNLTTEMLRVLNRGSSDLHSTIYDTVRLIREHCGFDAVGLRLRDGEDYPYFEYDGFSDEFLREENFLCEKHGDGSLVRKKDGRVTLECTCGLVLSARTDPSLPFFTKGGSFWTNKSDELLAIPIEEDPRDNPRNRCIHYGYQSVALIPVRGGDEVIGLLQLNGRREGMFGRESISFFESLADNIGMALRRKQVEEALQESEERFRGIVETAEEGIATHEPDGTITYVNQRMADMLGYPREEIIGRSSLDFVDEEDRESVIRAREGIAEQGSFSKERKLRRKDGTVLWTLGNITPRRDGDGNFIGYLAMHTDITERKQAEVDLGRQKDLLSAVAANTKAHLVYLDRDFNFMWVNQAYADACARAPEEFVGHNHFEFYPHEENQAIFERVRDTGEPFEIKEKPFIFPDHPEWGVTYWDWTLTPIMTAAGATDHLVFSLMDVTQDVLARQEIETLRAESERRAAELQSYVSSQADGVSMLDTEGRIVFMNDAGRAILRVPPDEDFVDWISRYQSFTLDGKPLRTEDRAWHRALQGERVTDLRYKTLTPFGETIILSVSAVPVVNNAGQVIGATTTFRDQSERVAFEDEKQSLLERERQISEMLQQALIPSQVPTTVSGCHFVAKYLPALSEAHVGGDFYDVFDLGNGRVGVLIGDVAGKGVRAAMQVSAARYAFRSYAYIEPSPARVVGLVNDALCRGQDSDPNMLTAFFAIVDTCRQTVSYTNGGHEPSVIRRADGSVEELDVGAMALGVLSGRDYPESTVKLEPCDLMVMVTDGITEARSEGRGMFGKSEMLQFLARQDSSPDELVERLVERAREYGGGQLQDDVAVVALRVEASYVEVQCNG